MENSISLISPHEASAKMQSGAALLDVREYPEWVQGHVAGAVLLPLGEVQRQPQRALLAPEVVLLCRSGKRASTAAQVLAEAGA